MEMSDTEEYVGSNSNFSSLSDTEGSFTEPPVKKRKLKEKMEQYNFDFYDVSNPLYVEEEVDLNNGMTQLVLHTAAEYAQRYPRNQSEEIFGRADCLAIQQFIKDTRNGDCILSPQQVWHRLMYAYQCFKEYCLLMKNGQDNVLFDYETGRVSPISPATNYTAVHCRLRHKPVITNFSLLKMLFFFTWSKISNCVEIPALAARTRKRSCSSGKLNYIYLASDTEEVEEKV